MLDNTVNDKTDFQSEIAALIIESLFLEDVNINSIDPDAPLFNDGLGLDSIDALELSLVISQRYGVSIRSDDPDIEVIFSSLRALSDVIERRRAA